MAVFSDKIINAYYTNPEHNTICILWSDGKVAREHHLPVDEDDDQFNDFLKEWSYESLEESTRVKLDNERNVFRSAFENYARDNNLYGYSENSSPEQKDKEEVILLNIEDLIFNFDPKDNQQKEELFKLKLKFFDRDEVKNSKAKKKKADLRKAESPLEAISIYHSFVK
tara:strand:- start:14544 stop:15050 length:507 start_codon:yes stop_codon:yes gene_type:complete